MRSEPSNSESRHAVVLERDVRLADVGALSAALAPLYPELTRIDVRQRCRYASGIIEASAPRPHACAVVEAIAAAGYASRVVPATAIRPLGPPARIRRLRLTPHAMSLEVLGSARAGTRAGNVEVDFAAIDLVLLFALDRPPRKIASLTADEAAVKRALSDTPLGPDAEKLQYALARYRSRERRDAALAIDVVVGSDVFRFERDESIWSKSGSTHSLEAFVYLGRRLAAHAPSASAAPENAALLDGMLEASLFQHPEELRRYQRWLLWRRAADTAERAENTESAGAAQSADAASGSSTRQASTAANGLW